MVQGDDDAGTGNAYDVTPIIHSRYFILPVSAAAVGTVVGAVRGSRMAALRFLAENAHRPPTTIRGWYLYNKTKNYRRMAAGLKHGGADALRLGVTTLVWVGIEDGLERCGYPWTEAKEFGAGVGTALVFSSVCEWFLWSRTARSQVAEISGAPGFRSASLADGKSDGDARNPRRGMHGLTAMDSGLLAGDRRAA
ncbi:hypothetical protein EV401DRAFT_1968440 [Pisolithus croceorrhizus]|nr:hypothetical protein EV401DRAFT_1968440 [Pisolithus croceorrhizus]